MGFEQNGAKKQEPFELGHIFYLRLNSFRLGFCFYSIFLDYLLWTYGKTIYRNFLVFLLFKKKLRLYLFRQ